jgi:hypothetical protein
MENVIVHIYFDGFIKISCLITKSYRSELYETIYLQPHAWLNDQLTVDDQRFSYHTVGLYCINVITAGYQDDAKADA